MHDADIRLNRDPATTTSADTSLSNTESQMDVQTQVKSLHYDWQLVNEDAMFSSGHICLRSRPVDPDVVC